MSAIDKWGYTAIFDDGSSVIGDSEQDLRNKIGNRKPALIYHYEGKDWEGYEGTDEIKVDEQNATKKGLLSILRESSISGKAKENLVRKLV